jgi:heme/copper-type cytochrome/quinol oxidase subunit 1
MIVQAAAPSVSVDPLLAKNVLWWFGHSVVYLLLFPAVAVFYVLVPKFAGRPLVAGNVIAVAWTIAVIANVVVWAHHIYLDYPVDSVQAGINTAMQPLTFELTIPSALSLYSLFMTIYRSNWRWTAASTAVFLALTSWLLAGLSGVVNATIAFDAFVHNTLWVVGHFHHMALLNIGLLVFAALYAWLPEWLGRPLYSERLALWHIWLTFFAGTANSVVWLIQGLNGAPRRFSVLPERYDEYTGAAIPFVWLLALAQLLFVWNLIMTLANRRTRATQASVWSPARRVGHLGMGAQAFLVVATIAALIGLGAAGWAVQNSRSAQAAPAAGGQISAGRQVFQTAGCGGCHTLAAAGSTGTVGPNLDTARPSRALVVQRVTNGRRAMPSFKSQLAPDQIQAVASSVTASTGP